MTAQLRAGVARTNLNPPIGISHGNPFDNVRLSYTHTHSGPSLGPTWLHEGDEMVPDYVNSLVDVSSRLHSTKPTRGVARS